MFDLLTNDCPDQSGNIKNFKSLRDETKESTTRTYMYLTIIGRIICMIANS